MAKEEKRDSRSVRRERLLSPAIPPHPNVATTHFSAEIGVEGIARRIFVMEYYPGKEIVDVRKQYQLHRLDYAKFRDGNAIARDKVKSALCFHQDLARDIAQALKHLQAYDLVHRDIKPPNILMIEDAAKASGYQFVLVDMGLARSMKTSTGLMSAEESLLGQDDLDLPITPRVGTPCFFPSRRSRAMGGLYSAQTDACSLGYTLAYLCFGLLSRSPVSGLAESVGRDTCPVLVDFINCCLGKAGEGEIFSADNMLSHPFLMSSIDELME